MKIQSKRIWVALLIMVSLTAGAVWPVAAREAQPEGAGSSLMLRLKYATFDPLQGEPQMPASLHIDAHRGAGEGAYIVQFKGPIQVTWTDQVGALGGRLMGYLPDFAYLVWMDGTAREEIATLDSVRWVGLYQPAYKLSPNLDRTKPLYRIVLFEGADLGAVSARLATLNTLTRQVTGEQFALLLPDGGIDQVANWPEVLWIENRPLYTVSNDVATGIMGATTAWGNGYTGAGQLITVADTGIDTGSDNASMHDDFEGRFAQIRSYPVDASLAGCAANVGADDGAADVASGHGTHVLGSVLGNGARSGGTIKGTAYQSTPTFQAVEQYTTWTGSCAAYSPGYYITGIPLDIKTLFQEAYNWGSRIHSNSWGAPVGGEYTPDSESVDQFVWDHPEMLIVFAAGNAGTDKRLTLGYVDDDSLDAPGTAKNALTVGASDNERDSGGYNPGGACSTWGTCWPSDFPYDPTKSDRISDNRGEMAAFSSRGPTDDLRRKPDVVAPGTNILSTRSSVAAFADYYAWGPYNNYYMYMGGTSMATPLVAGAAALVREYYVDGGHPTPSAALLKATLINSAVDIPGYLNTSQEAGKPIPNNHEGWGRVDVGAATSGERQFVDGLSVGTGQAWSDTYDIGSSATPFKVTLVWSDYPASVPAGGLVNDLDLVVTAPGGAVYRGNYFSDGWSVAGGTADRTNNVESVYIQSPVAGQWTVQVSGYNVAQPGGNPQQPFGLVATALFGPPPSPPIADFSGSPTSGELPLEVSFTDLSQNEVTGWLWDFGDTIGTSIEQHPTYTYAEAGDYTVSLTVTGPGGQDTETKTGYIHVIEPPSLGVDHATGAPGSYFVFTGQHFAPDDDATISVNGVDLAQTVPTNGAGDLEFALHTQLTASPGAYFVTASTGSSASAVFQLVSGAELWPPPPSGTIIDVPASIVPVAPVYLPLVMRYYAPPVPDEPIVNGDLELGPDVGWDEWSLLGYEIVMLSFEYHPAHSGDWLAWLGGVEDEIAYIEQEVTIPSGRSYLHYWHWRESSALDCNLNRGILLVEGVPVTTYGLCSATNTGGWQEVVVDLSAYVEQTVLLRFQIETGTSESNWYLDDISFEVSSAAAGAAAPTALDPGRPPARKTKSASDSPQP